MPKLNDRIPMEIRFWRKVDKTSAPNGCWVWTGAKVRGYGVIAMPPGHDKKMMRVNRYSWQLHHGPIPEGLDVLHDCDNPSCVRPDHLFLGTTQDNTSDRESKGRGAKGESIGTAKLNWETVREIRSLYASGDVFQKTLANRFGVNQPTISRVIRETYWKE